MTPRQSIGNTNEVQRHWQENGPVNEELRGIVDPLAEKFQHEMTYVWKQIPVERREALLEPVGSIYELPYGRVGILPPALFGDITKDEITQTRELVVPESDEEKEAAMAHYDAWVTRTKQSFSTWLTPNKDMMRDALDAFAGMEYPEAKWRMAAIAVQRTFSEEPFFFMDANGVNRFYNAASDYEQLNPESAATHRPYETYAFSLSRKMAGDMMVQGTRDHVMIPVGEYGVDGAAKLARVTLMLNDHIKRSRGIENHIKALHDDKTEELLVAHTARSREKKAQGVDDYVVHGLANTLTEGVVTVAQTIAMLTSEKLEPFETHDEFVRAVLDSDIVEQFTRLVMPGYIGPSTLAGVHLRQPVEMRGEKPVLTRNALDVLNEMRREYIEKRVAEWVLHREGKGDKPPTLGMPCPAARPKGGISQVKEVFKLFYEQPIDENADSL